MMCLNCRPAKIVNVGINPGPANNPVSADHQPGVRTLTAAADFLDARDMSYNAIDLLSIADFINRDNKENN